MQSSFLVKMKESKKPRKFKPDEKPEHDKKKRDYSDARKRKRGEE